LICVGCDLGTVSAKAVVVKDGDILASEVVRYTSHPDQAANEVLHRALATAGLGQQQVDACVATGLGAKAVPFANGNAPDMLCLQQAARALNPRVRTIIDVGGHSLAAFNLDDRGVLLESAVVDKCAAGTGIFIDMMAETLEMPLDELVEASLSSGNPLLISNQCVVFAESEVITLVNEGHDRFDIFAGIASSVAAKIVGLAGRINIDEEVALVGGVAKNRLVVRGIEARLGLKLADLGGVDPQVVAALGAALVAGEREQAPKRK